MLIRRKIRSGLKLARTHGRKWLWERSHNHAPNAVPVFIFGAQRSGTTMLGECLGQNPEVRHYPEHDGRAFNNFILRDQQVIQELISACPQRVIVFKPLTDSHRVLNLLEKFEGSKAIWMYRRYENRATSAVTKFGRHNLDLLREFAEGRGLDCWQAQGLGPEEIELIRSFSPQSLTPQAAAVLFWYLRNKLFFNQGLEEHRTVILVAYEHVIRHPNEAMREICRFLGCNFDPAMVRDIHAGSLKLRPVPDLSPRLRLLGDEMYEQLEQVRRHYQGGALRSSPGERSEPEL